MWVRPEPSELISLSLGVAILVLAALFFTFCLRDPCGNGTVREGRRCKADFGSICDTDGVEYDEGKAKCQPSLPARGVSRAPSS